MKIHLFHFLLFIISFGTYNLHAQTTYPSGVTGCIARWTFDAQEGGILSNIADESGNNNHGSNNFITPAIGWKGFYNTAGKFNGTNSFSQVPYNSMLKPTNLSIFALVKFDGFFSGDCQGNNIVYNGFNYNSNLNWAMYTTDGSYDNNCSAYNPNYNKMHFITPNQVNTSIPNSNYLDTSKWYLLVSTFNGSVINHYQIEMNLGNHLTNILPSYSSTCLNPIGTGNYDVFLGATQNPPFPYWFNGKMDEVILFNKVLSQSEIQSVYDYLFGFASSTEQVSEVNQNLIYTIGKTIYIDPSIRKLQLNDLQGKIILERDYPSDNKITLSDLPKQLLLAKAITSKGKIITKKIWIAE